MSQPRPLPVLDLGPQIESLRASFHDALDRVLDSAQFILGPETDAFERAAAAYLGTTHAVGLNSGTDALFIALRALGIGVGDEVITTPFTFFATAEAISHVGATPVFVDIEESSFNIDPVAVEAAVTDRTRAVLPVHLYGRPAAMPPLVELCRRHDIAMVEDCAQSFGARVPDVEGRPMTGTIGRIGTYSFFPSKNLGALGDGGLLVTDDPALAESARMLRAHGAKKKYFNEIVGYNSRLDALQAAFLSAKLPYLDHWNEGRRRVASAYGVGLADLDEVVTPEVSDGHVFHQYTIRVLGGRRDHVAAALGALGIATMLYYPVPVHRLPLYRDTAPALPVAERLSDEVLSLPIWPEMADAEIARVCDAIREALGS